MNRPESEVLRDVFLHFKKKCKEQKKRVDAAYKEYEESKSKFYYDDERCLVDCARERYLVEEAKLEQLVKDKISIEKYMRKLRHKEEEN